MFPGRYAGAPERAEWAAAFQTPCGDVGVSGGSVLFYTAQAFEFQTPCGDVGVSGSKERCAARLTGSRFQTPCGDVGVSGLSVSPSIIPIAYGFRPLAGMSVFPGL